MLGLTSTILINTARNGIAMRPMLRLLGHRVSVEALIEFALWCAVPYVTVGVLWAFLHPEQVQGFEAVLLTRVPAGADLIAYGLTAGLWPVLLLVPTLCGI